MKHRDPSGAYEPWLGAPSRVEDALVHARADLPSERRLARISAAMPLVPSVTAPAAAAPASTLSGAVIGAALGVVVSSGAFLWPTLAEPTRAGARPASFLGRASATPEASGAGAPTATLEAHGPPLARSAARRETPLVPARPEPSSSDARPAPPHEIAMGGDPPSPRPRAIAMGGDPPDPPPQAIAEKQGAEEARPQGFEGGAGLATDAIADAETEARALARAEDALASNPALALALAERHAARFARGALGQEREVLAIQALVRLGRADEGKARARRFLAAHPRSAHRPRIEALVGL